MLYLDYIRYIYAGSRLRVDLSGTELNRLPPMRARNACVSTS